MSQEEILLQIQEERERQETKWGEQNHQPDKWLVILGEEYGEACKEALEAATAKEYSKGLFHLQSYRDELIQVAAVAVSMIECLDRNTKK